MKTKDEIIKKYIPNGCINLKGIIKEREAISACMEEWKNQETEILREALNKLIEACEGNFKYHENGARLKTVMDLVKSEMQ